MGPLAIASAGVGLVSGVAGMIGGAKQKREAKQALDNFERQELSNVADEMSVYTRGTEMQLEESARLGASSVDALQRGGSRNLIGGIGRLQQTQQQQNIGITQNLEAQQARIDKIRAQDEARIRQVREQRDIADIQALSSQYQQGQAQFNAGISNMAGGAIGLAGSLQNAKINKDDSDDS